MQQYEIRASRLARNQSYFESPAQQGRGGGKFEIGLMVGIPSLRMLK